MLFYIFLRDFVLGWSWVFGLSPCICSRLWCSSPRPCSRLCCFPPCFWSRLPRGLPSTICIKWASRIRLIGSLDPKFNGEYNYCVDIITSYLYILQRPYTLKRRVAEKNDSVEKERERERERGRRRRGEDRRRDSGKQNFVVIKMSIYYILFLFVKKNNTILDMALLRKSSQRFIMLYELCKRRFHCIACHCTICIL